MKIHTTRNFCGTSNPITGIEIIIQQERIGSSKKREKEFHEKFGEPRIDSAITEYSNVSNFHDQNLK